MLARQQEVPKQLMQATLGKKTPGGAGASSSGAVPPAPNSAGPQQTTSNGRYLGIRIQITIF